MFTFSSYIFQALLLNIGFWILKKSHFEFQIEKGRGKIRPEQSFLGWTITYPFGDHEFLPDKRNKISKLMFTNPLPSLSEKEDDSEIVKELVKKHNLANQITIISIIATFVTMIIITFAFDN